MFFGYLARRGFQPFCDREIEYEPPVQKPNWDNLPKELSYLIDPAEAYGIFDDVEMVTFLENAHPEDIEILTKTAERMRLNGHSSIVSKWMDSFPIDKHPEAWMVYRVVGVMDLAGLKFE